MEMFVVCAICGVISAAIASSKGRTVVGWFFAGFFLGVIGIIIVACQSNLNEKKAHRQHTERERHRLREQLRQERLKTEAFRRHAVTRLDTHDLELGMDTRSVQTALPYDNESPLHRLAGGAQELPPGQSLQPRSAPGAQEEKQGQYEPEPQVQPQPHPQVRRASREGPPRAERAIWYYEVSGAAKGPVTASVIKNMLLAGQIAGNTLLWAEGIVDWRPAAQFKSFRALVRS